VVVSVADDDGAASAGSLGVRGAPGLSASSEALESPGVAVFSGVAVFTGVRVFSGVPVLSGAPGSLEGS
jgi:hypothetical protein